MNMLTIKAIPCEEYDSRAVQRKLLTMILFAIFNGIVSYLSYFFSYQITKTVQLFGTGKGGFFY